jgi:cell division protein FtsL
MKILIPALLMATVFVTAVQVVITQHQARKTFSELQMLEKARDKLDEEWGRLQLEQSTWATDDRIEKIARNQLNMGNPDINTIVLLAK